MILLCGQRPLAGTFVFILGCGRIVCHHVASGVERGDGQWKKFATGMQTAGTPKGRPAVG